MINSGVATGGSKGQSVPLDSKQLPKIGKRGKNQDEKSNIEKVLSLCPSWQIGLATLLVINVLTSHTLCGKLFLTFHRGCMACKWSCLLGVSDTIMENKLYFKKIATKQLQEICQVFIIIILFENILKKTKMYPSFLWRMDNISKQKSNENTLVGFLYLSVRMSQVRWHRIMSFVIWWKHGVCWVLHVVWFTENINLSKKRVLFDKL